MTTDLVVEQRLLDSIKGNLPELESLLERATSDWECDDYVYRFYHRSMKVYGVQSMTTTIVAALRELLPEATLNADFVTIVDQGTGQKFSLDANARWHTATRPLLEAFFHARFMLEMVVKFGKQLNAPPEQLPSGWAAVLYVYGLR